MVRTHNHAFWIYGVLVGLAIREALSSVIPHALPSLQGVGDFPPEPKHQALLEAMRLVLFLAMIIRFYLGSCQYFDRVYCLEITSEKYQRKNYSLDFLCGLIHFIIFYAWSETLITHNRFAHGLSPFLVFLGVVLLYDLVWWFLSRNYDTQNIIAIRSILNAASFILGLVILLVFNVWGWTGERSAEIFAGIPVAFVTMVDFGEMFGGTNVLTQWMRKILGHEPA